MSLHIDQPKSRNATKLVILSAFVLLLGSFTFLAITNRNANASIAGWDAGNIVSDAVFTNKNSLSVTQIQDFLNSKVPNCDTNGNSLVSYWYNPNLTLGQTSKAKPADPTGYTYVTTTRAIYGGRYNISFNRTDGGVPFVCLKDFVQATPDKLADSYCGTYIGSPSQTAAQIIYNAAQSCGINPQVLIVLLQKEQGLVTDVWPQGIQYQGATGYGCPDSSGCNSKYYGFFNQVSLSARMFRAIMNASPTWYTPYLLGNNYIQYNPQASCGGSTVNIKNRATQALYNYTPYQPNQAALDAGWGTVSCGAYGNRNFYLYFTDWFNSTQIPINCIGNETPASFVRSFYNPRTYQHFYSAFDCDIGFLERLGYINEGPIFNTTPSTAPWAVPIYRYYNPATGMHVWNPKYSTPEELLASNTGYQQEGGIVFYVARSDMPNVTPVISYYNPVTYQHVLGPVLNQQEAKLLKDKAGYDAESPPLLYSQ